MSEPLNTKSLRFYLNFKSPDLGRHECSEPVGFQDAGFSIQQRSDGMGRDIKFSGNDEIDFEFNSQDNTPPYHLDKILEANKIKGYECDIEFEIEDVDFGVSYLVGQLDNVSKTSDDFSFYACVMIQSTTQKQLERKRDAKVDVFSDTDLDLEPIEPVQTYNILVPAKPIIQLSKWSTTPVSFLRTNFGFQSIAVFPMFSQLLGSANITDSLVPFQTSFFAQTSIESGALEEQRDLNKIIRAVNDLTNIKIKITDLSFQSNGTSPSGVAKNISVNYGTGFSPSEFDTIILDSSNDDFFNVTNQDYETTIPFLQAGGYIWIRYSMFDSFTSGGTTPVGSFGFELTSGELEITLTSTAIDTVTKGVRLINGINQVCKSINQDFTVDAPRFESNGTHYNNFIVDGNMLRGREFPLVIPFKDVSDYINSEPNCDYEIDETEIFIGNDEDFYPNVEIGSFDIKPDDTFNIGYNERYTINEFNYKFNKYNQDKDDENTIDAVHTELETLNGNKNVENKKDIEVNFSRDPFLIATTQIKASSETSTSLTQDDTKFLLDCTLISPTQKGRFTRRLQHFVDGDGNLKLLGSGFNWTILGIGNDFTVIDTTNQGTYTVFEIDTNIITLTPVSATPTTIGEIITTVEYPFSGVDYIFRTNENFDLIEGVLSPENYGNLRYTIKRSIKNYWSHYLATANSYNDKDIKVTFFKNNVDLTTQYNGGDIINERDNITQEELQEPLLTPRLITTKVLCDFSTYRAFESNLKAINPTDTHIKTKGGFVRVCGNNGEVLKGYVQSSEFMWADNVLDLVLEEKHESQFTNITFSNGSYQINEVGYGLDLLPNLEYQAEDDYIQFFDANTRPLTNRTRFDFVTVNGVGFDSMVGLIDAIQGLEN